MKKIGFLFFVIIIIGGAYYLYQKQTGGSAVTDYQDLIKESSPVAAAVSVDNKASTASPTLTSMLEAGINTRLGLLQSVKSSQNSVDNYMLYLNKTKLNVNAVSEIELVKAFLIKDQQILLLAYNQGGNLCNKQYQVLTLNEKSYHLSSLFGSCLPLSTIEINDNKIIFKMPANNPYLGKDVLVSYLYQNGVVNLLEEPTAKDLKLKYAKLSASAILQIAAKDGCYTGGVLLDDNACGNGHKYCVMFKNVAKKSRADPDYKLLQDFCK